MVTLWDVLLLATTTRWGEDEWKKLCFINVSVFIYFVPLRFLSAAAECPILSPPLPCVTRYSKKANIEKWRTSRSLVFSCRRHTEKLSQFQAFKREAKLYCFVILVNSFLTLIWKQKNTIMDFFQSFSDQNGGSEHSPENIIPQPSSTRIMTDSSYATAKYNYDPQRPDELRLQRGDSVRVVERSSDGWWKGEFNGQTGWFPSNVRIYNEWEYYLFDCFFSMSNLQLIQHPWHQSPNNLTPRITIMFQHFRMAQLHMHLF